ncbi:MAG: DUF2273 domain-containing protein [Clostridiales bacterium]|nr:DUF2273 domain-containing protein [Clostridiales bacterium]
MLKGSLKNLFIDHKGKTIGVLVGFLFGLIVILIGFWKTLFLTLCILIGYLLGGMTDKKERFISFLDKILPKGTNSR